MTDRRTLPETKARISATRKRQWQDPEFRARNYNHPWRRRMV